MRLPLESNHGSSSPCRAGLSIGSRAFEMAYGHRPQGIGPLVAAPALAWPHAHPAQDAGKYVVFLVDAVGSLMVSPGDEADVLGNVRLRRARRLAGHVHGDRLAVQGRGALACRHRVLSKGGGHLVADAHMRRLASRYRLDARRGARCRSTFRHLAGASRKRSSTFETTAGQSPVLNSPSNCPNCSCDPPRSIR